MKLRVSLSALILASLAAPVFGHGIPTELAVDANNKLVASQLVSYTASDSVIAGNPTAAPVRLRGTTSFTAVESLKPITFTMEATGNIWQPTTMLYWDGTSLSLSPVSVHLTRTGIDVTVNPSDTSVAIPTLPVINPGAGTHTSINMDLPLGSPAGLYAFGWKASAPGFTTSDTFWSVGNNAFTGDVGQGLAVIRAAVPEPGSISLLLGGIAGMALYGWRRRASKSS